MLSSDQIRGPRAILEERECGSPSGANARSRCRYPLCQSPRNVLQQSQCRMTRWRLLCAVWIRRTRQRHSLVNPSLTILIQPTMGARRSEGMSAQVGTGLLLDCVMMLGGAVGIGLPMAAAIIWVFS